MRQMGVHRRNDQLMAVGLEEAAASLVVVLFGLKCYPGTSGYVCEQFSRRAYYHCEERVVNDPAKFHLASRPVLLASGVKCTSLS